MSDEEERRRVGEAISSALPEDYVIKWVLAAEVMDAAGEKGCWVLASPGMQTWDALGLAEYVKLTQGGTE